MAANVLIDLEVLYYLSRNEPPLHRYLHTYAGGLAAGMVAGLLMFGVIQVLRRLLPADSRWEKRLAQTPRRQMLRQSILAGVIGGASHILLDSLMHAEMQPFWPLAEGNVLAGIISVPALHITLAAIGFFGLIFWLLLREP
ncbi:hypothetical protein Pan241w_38520 [Gimesia alba]|uniref:DUF4184 family protein n=1 Tax=Gimesia alba TaxID=2527973 RepID=A0A517RIQ2_9PLAN|nr:hypothetical protein Pan241w_38520 [Gimesia alba]